MIPVVSNIVEVCVFRFRNDMIEYLVLKRSPGERIHPGMWQLITGTTTEGERGVRTAIREMQEETGLVPQHFWAVPVLTSFYDRNGGALNHCPVFAAQADPASEVKISEEHCDFAWLPVAQARRRLVWPSHRAVVEMVDAIIVRGEEAATRLSIPIS
jgi:dihydroneopterin triphosphate diphosphatase